MNGHADHQNGFGAQGNRSQKLAFPLRQIFSPERTWRLFTFSSDMADPVPDLNVLPGPQRGSTSISITPNAFTVFNDPVERTGDADSGAPVTGTKPQAPAGFPWWILLVVGGLWWISRDE